MKSLPPPILSFLVLYYRFGANLERILNICWLDIESCRGTMMLEKREERVKLLRTGLTGKAIEKLYIKNNNFRIIRAPVLFDPETASETF